MPTITFFNLPKEKKDKIISAAKKEFSRVELNKASIKNIADEACISRGSFYQYFESKEDLLDYVFESIGDFKELLLKKLNEPQIDIFEINREIFDCLIEKLHIQENIDFARKIFSNLKVSDIDFLKLKTHKEEMPECFQSEEFINKIISDKLNIYTREDLIRFNQMLMLVTKGMLAASFASLEKEVAAREYYATLNLIKQAFEKKERKNI